MNVCVFCGSRFDLAESHRTLAVAVGRALGEAGHRLVYGGASVGLMGALADACLASGGEVVGIIPEDLAARELAHPGLHEQVEVGSLAERKTEMVARSDAFVTLPGGIGTLDELFEVWTMRALGLHARPMWVVDPQGYYGSLRSFLERIAEQGFMDRATLCMLGFVETPAELIERLAGR